MGGGHRTQAGRRSLGWAEGGKAGLKCLKRKEGRRPKLEVGQRSGETHSGDLHKRNHVVGPPLGMDSFTWYNVFEICL